MIFLSQKMIVVNLFFVYLRANIFALKNRSSKIFTIGVQHAGHGHGTRWLCTVLFFLIFLDLATKLCLLDASDELEGFCEHSSRMPPQRWLQASPKKQKTRPPFQFCGHRAVCPQTDAAAEHSSKNILAKHSRKKLTKIEIREQKKK